MEKILILFVLATNNGSNVIFLMEKILILFVLATNNGSNQVYHAVALYLKSAVSG